MTSSSLNTRPGLRRAVLLGAVIGAAAAVVLGVRALAVSPERPFLMGEHGATWLRPSDPVDLLVHSLEEEVTGYRVHFRVDAELPEAVLTLRAMKAANVFLDEVFVYDTGPATERWKERRQIDLTDRLRVGEHELKVLVTNRDGPPCLLAYSTALNLATGPGWEASNDGVTWSPAVTVDDHRPADLSRNFVRADKALWRSLPLLAFVFIVAFAWSLAVVGEGRLAFWARRLTPTAWSFRWMLMGAVGVLAANNIFKLAYYYGFDIAGHVEYMQYVAGHWRIPLPTHGWCTSQAPLYYMLSAPLYKAFEALFETERAQQALRILPLACGIAQVEVVYRAARYLFPQRDDLQRMATAVGGLLPVSLYMSQYVSNESPAGLLVGVTIVLALRFHYDPQRGRTWGALLLLGAVLGLAWLTKLTAMFLMPPLAALMVYGYATAGDGRRGRRMIAGLALVFGMAVLVAGWYYARNYLVLGRAFWGGWEPERGIQWWQDPGYRTLRQLTPTGEALVYPVFSSVVSFWDGVYSTLWTDSYLGATTDAAHLPPWNYNLMLSGVLLGLAPSATMLVGVTRALQRRPESPGLLFMAVTLGLYGIMLLYGFLSVPYYCIIKAPYTLGLTCCYGALAAAGFGLLAQTKVARALMTAAITTWAVAAYGAYFIVS